jgi:hypothetical protein
MTFKNVMMLEAEDWDGPAYQTCANAASVCKAIETSRRREVLSFNHHAEVAALHLKSKTACSTWPRPTAYPS